MITVAKPQRLSRVQAADYLGCHPASVDRYTSHGYRGHRLPRHRIGGRVYYLPHEIDAWQEALDRQDGNAPANEPTVEARAECADALCESLGV